MSEAGGRIVLHREWSFMWAGSPKSKIRIDGAERGAVSNGGTLAIDVGAGEHSIQVAQGVIKRDLLVSVEAAGSPDYRVNVLLRLRRQDEIAFGKDTEFDNSRN